MDVNYQQRVHVLLWVKWGAIAVLAGFVVWIIAYHVVLGGSLAEHRLQWTVTAVALAALVVGCAWSMDRLWRELDREHNRRLIAQEALERRSQQLILLNQASTAFSSTLDVDQVLATVLEEVRRLLGGGPGHRPGAAFHSQRSAAHPGSDHRGA